MGDVSSPEKVGRARSAAAVGDFDLAFDLLRRAEADRPLPPADLVFLGEVAYAAGHLDVTIEAWEQVHAAHVKDGQVVGAAEAAVRVAMHLLFDTALTAPVRGWLAQAERLLEGCDEAPAHAWLAAVRANERLLSGDVDGARQWADAAAEIGSRRDPAAAALGRVAIARLLILEGRVEEGLGQLDQAGVAAVSGSLDPLATGVVYCEVVCALQGLAQYDLAEEWTEAMERWCQTNAIGSVRGRCRVHRAEILRLRGSCGEAERQALMACEELRPYLRRELGWPLAELGRIRLHRGDIEGAEESLLAAHRAGWDPEPGLALVRLAQGDPASAAAAIRDALDHPIRVPSKERPPSTDLQRVPLLQAQVEIEIAIGDLDQARSATDELTLIATRFHSKALIAGATLAAGRVRLADGDAAGAEASLSEAARLWNEIGAPFEAAHARIALADALAARGNDHRASLERAAAYEILNGIKIASPLPAPARPRLGDTSLERPTGTIVFRREGDYWALTFDGDTVRIRDIKGMRYLARLLAEPDREYHVLDLAAAESGRDSRAQSGTAANPPHSALGDAGEVLDSRAKDAYRRRLREIDDDIEEARTNGDTERLSQVRDRTRLPRSRTRTRVRPRRPRPTRRVGIRTGSSRRNPLSAPGDRQDHSTPPHPRRPPQPHHPHRHLLRLPTRPPHPGRMASRVTRRHRLPHQPRPSGRTQ